MARQALAKQQSDLLTALLPEAPDGFTRTLTEDFSQGFAMAGGGSGAEARYDSADGATSFTLSFVADNPMVASGLWTAMLYRIPGSQADKEGFLIEQLMALGESDA